MDIMNLDAMREQENKDYEMTVTIFDSIFGKWKHTPTRMDENAPTDMRYTVEKNGISHYYNVEIKSRNTDLERYPTLPLTVKKYNSILSDTKDNEKTIYISLVNGAEYYIFDLSDININLIEKRNWRIKRKEYHKDGYEIWDDVPTYFFPISKCVCYGKI